MTEKVLCIRGHYFKKLNNVYTGTGFLKNILWKNSPLSHQCTVMWYRDIKIIYSSFKCYICERSHTDTCRTKIIYPNKPTESALNSILLFILDKWAYWEVSLTVFHWSHMSMLLFINDRIYNDFFLSFRVLWGHYLLMG